MTCEEALVLISGHIDQENTPEEEAVLQAHLEVCEDCRRVMTAFLEMENGLSQLEEPPAKLREQVMTVIRAESPVRKKKARGRWGSVVCAAALVAVIGFAALELPMKNTDTAPVMTATAPQTAELPTTRAVMDAPAEYVEASSTTAEVDVQALAEELQADVVLTYDLLPEMEVCPCETLESGGLLYRMETADGAVNLSRIYGVELYQPSGYEGSYSYALLLPRK